MNALYLMVYNLKATAIALVKVLSFLPLFLWYVLVHRS